MGRVILCCAALAASLACGRSALAATIAAPFSNNYTLIDLGPAQDVSPSYGGLTIDPSNTNRLLIGGIADTYLGVIDAVTVTRDSNGHITGFTGSAQQISTASTGAGGIDGGLAVGPGGVIFFSSYPDNHLGEIKPGSSSVDKSVDLTAAGVSSSTGAATFVPSGFANAGHLKISSYNAGQIYDTTVTPDGSGTYNIGPVTAGPVTGGGPEGLAFIGGGNANFPTNSVLITEYGLGRVSAYQVDGASDPILATRQDFVTGLSGAAGATVDPVTGDFLFSTFGGGNHVIEVRGFVPLPVPEPSAVVLAGIGVVAFCAGRRRIS